MASGLPDNEPDNEPDDVGSEKQGGDGGTPMTGETNEERSSSVLAIAAVVVVPAALIFCLLSAVSPNISYNIYAGFMSASTAAYVLGSLGTVFLLIFHLADEYHRSGWLRLIWVSVILYLFLGAGACFAKSYPGAVLSVAHLQVPIGLGLISAVSSTSAYNFQKTVFASCLMAVCVVAFCWVVWVFSEDMLWNDDTKLRLRGGWMRHIYTEYGVADWDECLVARADDENGAGDDALLSKCAHIELTAFLIWAAPLVEIGAFAALGLFSYVRAWSVQSPGRTELERVLKLLLFSFAFVCCAFWVACSTAGASMGLSNLLYGSLAAVAVVISAWVVSVLDMEALRAKASETMIWKVAEPLMSGDWAAAFFFCIAHGLLALFLLLELVIQRIRPQGEGWLTPRGRIVWDFVVSKHWVSVLEKVIKLSMLYLVFYLFSKLTPVFLAWLSDQLPSSFVLVVFIFYIVGLVMFLLPPVPGVPVYMAAGFIIFESGKETMPDQFTGTGGFLVAFMCVSGVCLVLKLNAVALQQKAIGEFLGSSLYVQQLVGVHTLNIRAIEKILKKPGLGLEKVLILCGGPDWPTSVLTGILHLPLFQMLLGTLPVLFLLMPAVLAGASLTEPTLSNYSAILVLMVGVTQGAAMLLALVFIAREVSRSHDELAQRRPEHDRLLEKVENEKLKTEEYKLLTKWNSLYIAQKFLLIAAVSIELVVCVATAFSGSSCFKPFEIGNKIDATYAQGGLDGDVRNVVEYPYGTALIYSMLFGVGVYMCYSLMTTWVVKHKLAPEDAASAPPPAEI